MEDCFIGKRNGSKCNLKWYIWKLGFKASTGLLCRGDGTGEMEGSNHCWG